MCVCVHSHARVSLICLASNSNSTMSCRWLLHKLWDYTVKQIWLYWKDFLQDKSIDLSSHPFGLMLMTHAAAGQPPRNGVRDLMNRRTVLADQVLLREFQHLDQSSACKIRSRAKLVHSCTLGPHTNSFIL